MRERSRQAQRRSFSESMEAFAGITSQATRIRLNDAFFHLN